MKDRSLVAYLLSLGLLFGAGNVYAAAISSSIAVIDWTTLSVDDGGLTIQLVNQVSGSHALASNDLGESQTDTDGVTGWGFTESHATVTNAQGSAGTDAELVAESVDSGADGIVNSGAFAHAEAWRFGEFTIADPGGLGGTITISVGYYLEQGLNTDAWGEHAYGYAEAGLSLANNTSNAGDEFSDILETAVSNGDDFLETITGTLTVSLDFQDGDTGFMNFWVSNDASAQVPEPGTVALVGAGLLLVAPFRRRKGRK